MTPTQRIKRHILCSYDWSDTGVTFPKWAEMADGAVVNSLFEQVEDADFDGISDALNDFRSSGIRTELPCDYSRHYESAAVARELIDGTWVGWTYWYGGGKHGEPESMEWLDDAYDVKATEEMRPVMVFERVT